MHALHRPAGLTRQARSARVEADHDRVAGRDAGNRVTNALDDAGAFVAQDGGQGERGMAVPHRQIGVAHAGGGDLDQDLVRAGFVDPDVRQLERLVDPAGDGGGGRRHGQPPDYLDQGWPGTWSRP